MSYPVYKRELGVESETFEACKAKILHNAEEFAMAFEFIESNEELIELLQAARERVRFQQIPKAPLCTDHEEIP